MEQPSDAQSIDVVVIGGGQAGISTSFHLKALGVPHVVLERDRPFASWAGRWDGFSTNTPNWMNTLPMLSPDIYPSGDPTAFATRDEMVEYLQRCLEATDPPLEIGRVQGVTQLPSGAWRVTTADHAYEAPSVVICTGAMSRARLPKAQAEVGPEVAQIHSREYRNPDQIKTSRVLVVGSASSGVQICRLLGESGRFSELGMAVSRVTTLPKRILGVQTHRFLHRLGLFDVERRSLIGRLMYSRLETKGDPIMRPNPRDLAEMFGVVLHDRFAGVDGDALLFADGTKLGTDDLTIVWCTGLGGDYRYIEVGRPESVFEPDGSPNHVRGVVDAAPGLYFVGLRYQHTVASHDIYGVAKDAAFVAEQVLSRRLAFNGAWSPQGART